MLLRKLQNLLKRPPGRPHSESGSTLVEMLVAIFILSVVGGAALLALTGASDARMMSDVRTTAVSLADTNMENIKGDATPYKNATGSFADYTNALTFPAGLSQGANGYRVFTLDNTGNPVSDCVYGIPWNISTKQAVTGADPGIQKVTIIVEYNGNNIFQLSDFKVNR